MNVPCEQSLVAPSGGAERAHSEGEIVNLASDQASEASFSGKSRAFLALREAVMDAWEREVRQRIQGASGLLTPILTNSLPAFFDNLAEALSDIHPRRFATSNTNAASVHGDERARMTPFSPDQVVHEYQILREVIAAVAKGRLELTEADWSVIDRSINAATREAIRVYSASHEAFRRKVAAALSHDMRTPLSVISSGAQLIGVTTNIVMAHNVAAKIVTHSRRLDVMMGDLLDALTLQGRAQFPLSLTRFDLAPMLEDVRDQYCLEKGALIQVDIGTAPLVGYWCEKSLRRALENLVNNAIKYGDGQIISIKAAETRGRLMLSVHNFGEPIPKVAQNRIFDYLSRDVDAVTKTGWGVGLQFVKTIAESHGGSALVDSAAETGTCFVIDVPLDCRPFVDDPQHGAPGEASAASACPGSQRRLAGRLA